MMRSLRECVMPCETCRAPLAYDPQNGERFCTEDPSHDIEEETADGAR